MECGVPLVKSYMMVIYVNFLNRAYTIMFLECYILFTSSVTFAVGCIIQQQHTAKTDRQNSQM